MSFYTTANGYMMNDQSEYEATEPFMPLDDTFQFADLTPSFASQDISDTYTETTPYTQDNQYMETPNTTLAYTPPQYLETFQFTGDLQHNIEPYDQDWTLPGLDDPSYQPLKDLMRDSPISLPTNPLQNTMWFPQEYNSYPDNSLFPPPAQQYVPGTLLEPNLSSVMQLSVFPAPYQPPQETLPPYVPAPSLVAPPPPPPPPLPLPPQQQQAQAQRPPAPNRVTKQRTNRARTVKTPQQCAICSYQSANTVEFRRHVDSTHNNIRRHRCELCNVNLNDPSGLSKHKKSLKHRMKEEESNLTPSFNEMYECPGCRNEGREKRFPRPDQLKRHMLKCSVYNGVLPAGFGDGKNGMLLGKV